MYYLFDTAGNFLATCNHEPNLEDLASRGERAIFSEQVFDNPHLVDGNIIEQGKQPSPFHCWQNGQWVLSKANQTKLLEQRRAALIQQVADKTDNLKAQILVGYPQAEIDSFYRQEREARAWVEDNQRPTPMLSGIAAKRGLSLAVLVQKVIEKADQFAGVMGQIIGSRQAFEDRILQANTNEQLTTLEQEIQQWQ